MGREKNQYDDDDGRVICNMDVEGMRWSKPRTRPTEAPAMQPARRDTMTRSEAWRYTWSSVLAGLTVVGVFSGVWVLFILFCTQVWFK